MSGLKNKRESLVDRPNGAFKLSMAAVAGLNRVEGLIMPDDMVETFSYFDRAGINDAERREVLKKKYGRAG